MTGKFFTTYALILVLLVAGCASITNDIIDNTGMASTITHTPVPTEADPSPIRTITPTATNTPTATQTVLSPTETITPTPEPEGCRQPSDDYERVIINGHHLNKRTHEMLAYAATLYEGPIDITGDAITQGSYTSAVEASFGTHAGGGAVDLSVMAPGTYIILEDDIEPLVKALRLAGFAAWYRDFDDLYPGSPVHIHAIAIGDQELSWPARQQLTGPHGYFLGFNGLPVDRGYPERDPHSGPIVCTWMVEMGYPNQTATPPPE